MGSAVMDTRPSMDEMDECLTFEMPTMLLGNRRGCGLRSDASVFPAYKCVKSCTAP